MAKKKKKATPKKSKKKTSVKSKAKKKASSSKVKKKTVAKKKATAKKKVAKKKVAKKVAKKKIAKKKVVKKTETKKKTVKKKAVAKKKTAKKVAKKKVAKKKVAKKVVAKKVVAKKAPSKKVALKKKAVVKKVPTKKTKVVENLEVDGASKDEVGSPVVEKELSSDVSLEIEEADLIDEIGGFEEDVILTDAEGRRYCKVTDCDQIGLVEDYCRYHYLLHWKRIQVRKKIISEGKLEKYIEEFTSKYPLKFIEMIRKDLKSEKDFMSAVRELEIDENVSPSDEDAEETQSLIDEMRGTAGFDESMKSSDDDY